MNEENGKERKRLVRSQENLQSKTKLKSLKIKHINSKSEMTKKKCDWNLNEDDKKFEKITIKKNMVKKTMYILKYEMNEIIN